MQGMSSNEKIGDESSKSLNADDNPDGEEIADDLSEISDEADDILGQQEVIQKQICSFPVAVKTKIYLFCA